MILLDRKVDLDIAAAFNVTSGSLPRHHTRKRSGRFSSPVAGLKYSHWSPSCTSSHDTSVALRCRPASGKPCTVRAGMRADASIVRSDVDEIRIARRFGQQQFDVGVRRRVIQAPQQFGRERRGVRRMVAHIRDQTSTAVFSGSLITGSGGNGGVVSDSSTESSS